jgi:hypothetical protein
MHLPYLHIPFPLQFFGQNNEDEEKGVNVN